MVRKTYLVTIPYDMPAPRRAQNRSVFCVAEAVTTVLFASTTSADVKKSSARP